MPKFRQNDNSYNFLVSIAIILLGVFTSMGILNVQQATGADGSVRNLTTNPTNHQILSRGNVIGLVQSFSPSESRTVQKVMGLGIEGVITSAVGNYSGGTFQTPLIMIYDQTPMEAFGVIDQGGGVGGLRQLPRVISLKQQRTPLDIRSVLHTPNEGEQIVETYKGCWITSYSKTIAISGATVGVSVGWSYEDVIT